jgi:hypothetical protein
VSALSPADQLELFDWLELDEGQTQVVSTSSSSVIPRVHSGGFIDTLYYRLNTVCVDVTL